MTLNEVTPNYDVREYHQTFIRASSEDVYRNLKSMDFRSSRVARILLWLRAGGKPAGSVTLEQFWQTGFLLLSDVPNQEVVLGLVGRFWTPSGGRLQISPQQFIPFDDPRYGKVAFNFLLTEQPGGTLLATETRVKLFRYPERFYFHCYWTLIRPFSGLIRKEMLRQVKRACES
jgi:hypothetical protein